MSRDARYRALINSKRWKELRRKKLSGHPFCEECDLNDIVTPATEVHHRIPVESAATEAQMKGLMFNYLNLQSLCHDCHAAIHAEAFSHSKEAIKENNNRKTKRFIDKWL